MVEGNKHINGLYMKHGENGWGVYCNNDIKSGELIERVIMYRLKNVDGNENPHVFTWSDDRTVWAGGSGFSPFYNHSSNPNMIKKGDLNNDILEYYAGRDIKKGEELVGAYFSKKWRTCFQSF